MPTNPHAPGQGANPHTCAAARAAAHIAGVHRALSAAERSASGARQTLTKAQLHRGFRYAVRELGLSRSAEDVGALLISLAGDDDWKAGKPLVWASNRTIAIELQLHTRSIARGVTELERHGIVVRRCGGNGQRYRHCNADGTVIAQSGIDLSPMIAHIPLWIARAAAYKAECLARVDRCRSLTSRRMDIRRRADRLFDFEDDGHVAEIVDYVEERFRGLTTTDALADSDTDFDHLDEVMAQAEDDLHAIEVAVCDNFGETHLSPMDDSVVTLQTRTKQQSEISTGDPDRRAEGEKDEPDREGMVSSLNKISGALLRAACPTFMSFYGFAITRPGGGLDPERLANVGETMCGEIDVGRRLWADAVQTLGGRPQAAILIAYVFERRHSPHDHIRLRDPAGSGGYVRGCIREGKEDKLNLGPSMQKMARFHQRIAQTPPPPPRPSDEA